ncbi:DUF1178 family protein [Pelagibacterales bacterium SAG-MED09]|nr:DUF1178 family protein [Pelagibacterales bacterium SAG-MED09]
MIKYSLICKDCDLAFESWFSNSKDYEKLKKKNVLNCQKCNSTNIEKSLMAPNLINTKSGFSKDKDKKKYNKIKKTILEYQKFIKNNFEYVGNNFAYEARSIHYREKKQKSIYGTASKKDLKELNEEGIDTQMIPWFEDKNN